MKIKNLDNGFFFLLIIVCLIFICRVYGFFLIIGFNIVLIFFYWIGDKIELFIVW